MAKKKRLVTVNDLMKYKFCYESIYCDKETKECFVNYLKESHNEELFYFIQKVQRFKKKEGSQKAKLAIEIYNEFIKIGSIYELNLSPKDKSPVIEEFERTNQLNDSDNCKIEGNTFHQLEQIIHLSLKEANFPNFIESKHFREYAFKQTTDYLDRIGFRINNKKIDIMARLNSSLGGSSNSFEQLMQNNLLLQQQGRKRSSGGNVGNSVEHLYGDHSPSIPSFFSEIMLSQKSKTKEVVITMDDFRFLASKCFKKPYRERVGSSLSLTYPSPNSPVVGNGDNINTIRSLSSPTLLIKKAMSSTPVNIPDSMSLSDNSIDLSEGNTSSSSLASVMTGAEELEEYWDEVEKCHSNFTTYVYHLKHLNSNKDEELDELLQSLKNVQIFKTEMDFPYKTDFVVETLTKSQYRIQFDSMLKESYCLDFIRLDTPVSDEDERREVLSCSVLQEIWKFPTFGFGLLQPKERSFVLQSSLIYDKRNHAYFLIKKSFDNVEIDDDSIRGRLLHLMTFERRGKELTHFTDFVIVDMRDKVSKLIFDGCVTKRGKDLYEKGMEALKKNKDLIKSNFHTPDDSDRLLETLTENRKLNYCTLSYSLRGDSVEFALDECDQTSIDLHY
ncbi:hypothetical protein ABK040_002237 [Willaertia magna]